MQFTKFTLFWTTADADRGRQQTTRVLFPPPGCDIKKRYGKLTKSQLQKYCWVTPMKNRRSIFFCFSCTRAKMTVQSQSLVGNNTTNREGRGGAGKREKKYLFGSVFITPAKCFRNLGHLVHMPGAHHGFCPVGAHLLHQVEMNK